MPCPVPPAAQRRRTTQPDPLRRGTLAPSAVLVTFSPSGPRCPSFAGRLARALGLRITSNQSMYFIAFTSLVFSPVLASGQANDSVPASTIAFSQTYACRQAEMPIAALHKGVSGRTEVAFKVNEDASLTDVTVTATAGESREHKMLDSVAREHVKSCKYVGPNQRPSPGVYRVSLVWRLE